MVARGRNSTSSNHSAINRLIRVQWHGRESIDFRQIHTSPSACIRLGCRLRVRNVRIGQMWSAVPHSRTVIASSAPALTTHRALTTHSARCSTGAPLPATPCPGAFRRPPPRRVDGSVRLHALHRCGLRRYRRDCCWTARVRRRIFSKHWSNQPLQTLPIRN
jgi:hypothetical protein